MSPAATAYTQGHVWTRWRADDPANSCRWRVGACDWTKSHLTNTSATKTLCGLVVPDYPYLQDVDDQIPKDWPVCKRCEHLAKTVR